MRRHLIAFTASAVLAAGAAHAQSPVQVPSVNPASGTVASTNTFQKALAAAGLGGRQGCLITNTGGTDTLYLYYGATASATLATSIPLPPGRQATCWLQTGVVYSGNIAITGTTGDTFVVMWQ